MMKFDSNTEIEFRFWPLRISVKGAKAVGALRWPIACVTIAIGFATAAAILVNRVVLVIGVGN